MASKSAPASSSSPGGTFRWAGWPLTSPQAPPGCRRRFVPLSILAGVTWALYTVGIGVWAGAWFRETPLLGAVIAVVVAILVGFVIDRISAARATARERAIGTTGTTGTARTPHATARLDAARIPPVRATMREDHARIPFN